jgi:hypothetical protein
MFQSLSSLIPRYAKGICVLVVFQLIMISSWTGCSLHEVVGVVVLAEGLSPPAAQPTLPYKIKRPIITLSRGSHRSFFSLALLS